jgi:ribonucleotide reductase class II
VPEPEISDFPASAPAAEAVFCRTYSRKGEQGRESWREVVERNLRGLTAIGKLTAQEQALLRTMQLEQMALPSGRWLWVGGTDWIEKPENFSGAYNCLHGDTRVLTREGYKPISELASAQSPVEVVNANGDWVPVTFRSYGQQGVVKVTFSRKGGARKTVLATAEHQWVTPTGRTATKYLAPGHRVQRVFAPKPVIDMDGVRHGIIYGDGTVQDGRFFVDLCGDKYQDLKHVFDDVRKLKHQKRAYCDGEFLKGLPLNPTPEYLRGFVIGLLAADGSVSGSTVSISGTEETVRFIADIAPAIGYGINSVRLLYAAGEDSNLGSRRRDLWSVAFCKASIDTQDLLRSKHRKNFSAKCADPSFWRVESVETEAEVVEVFCCEEPETHAFVLDDGLLTGNCTSTNLIDWEAFALMMDLAMMGCGTGAVIEPWLIKGLPKIRNRIAVEMGGGVGTLPQDRRLCLTSKLLDPPRATAVITVGDSRHGWVEAYRTLLELSTDEAFHEPIHVTVHLSHVRPAGEPLKGFGGVANPVKLQDLFGRLAAILNRAHGRQLTAVECCLLIDEAALVIVAGNIRRSAGMRQFNAKDEAAAAAKDSLWQQDGKGGWRIDPERDALRMANHTRVFHTKPSREEVLESVQKQFHSGEGAIQYAPEAVARSNADLLDTAACKQVFIDEYCRGQLEGAIYLDRLGGFQESREQIEHRIGRYGLNPCGEITGQDFHCNLAEVHLNRLDPHSSSEQVSAFKAATLSAAALLHHRFDVERFRKSREWDPIVGVSFTGLFDFFVKDLGVDWLRWFVVGRPDSSEGDAFREAEAARLHFWREIVKNTLYDYCTKHDLTMPNRYTTVQPAGTKSLLTNASPGWHPPKAQRFIRRITFRRDDPVALACLDQGFSIVPSQSDKDEHGRLLDDPFDPRCTEWLVEIPTEVPWANLPGADEVDLSQISALAQFDFYMQVQKHYTTHNTSATIEFREHEIEPLADAIHDAIAKDRGYISAALLARFDANETFPRLPFEPIDKGTFERLQGEVEALRKPGSFYEALRRYDGGQGIAEAGPAGCDSDKCLMPIKEV